MNNNFDDINVDDTFGDFSFDDFAFDDLDMDISLDDESKIETNSFADEINKIANETKDEKINDIPVGELEQEQPDIFEKEDVTFETKEEVVLETKEEVFEVVHESEDIEELFNDEEEPEEEPEEVKEEKKGPKKPKARKGANKPKDTKKEAKKEININSIEDLLDSDEKDEVKPSLPKTNKINPNEIKLPNNLNVKIYGTVLFTTNDEISDMTNVRKRLIELGYTEFEDATTSKLKIVDDNIVDDIQFHSKG